MTAASLHVDLDGAWPIDALPASGYFDASQWGPALRFTTSTRLIESFYAGIRDRCAPFTLYGSGDFHHLAALWLRCVAEPFTLVSFDNHPDWDVRPPRWACGGWINRALELPHLSAAHVWGLGNFELHWPNRLFACRAALREGRLTVHPWAERLPARDRGLWPCVTRADWRDAFESFVRSMAGGAVYITVDLDCLAGEEAATNWENGLFTAADVAWAIGRLREQTRIAGGDVCGAWSVPHYARWTQRFAARFDHPKLPAVDPVAAQRKNLAALEQIWPVLTGTSQP